MLINISGTHNYYDWFVIVVTIFCYITLTSRYREARDILKNTKLKYNNCSVMITAHSLGSNIANLIAEDTDKIVNFNGFFTPNQKARKNDDIVSFFSPSENTTSYPNTNIKENFIKNILEAHKVVSIDDNDIILNKVKFY